MATTVRRGAEDPREFLEKVRAERLAIEKENADLKRRIAEAERVLDELQRRQSRTLARKLLKVFGQK